MKSNGLTYRAVDELELTYSAGLDVPKLAFRPRSLGPLIQLQRSSLRANIVSAIETYGDLEDAARFVMEPRTVYVNRAGNIGISSVGAEDAALELMQRALIAINRTPLPRDAAAQVVSALEELASNIQEHSEDVATGIVGFEVQDRFLGIYASDNGIGVLSSLRRNVEYAGLEDSGAALRLALKEGVSSSTEPGRGLGFRPIFVGLASLCAFLRFRSGDSLLEINGFGGGRPTQDLFERAHAIGFHVFVHCTFSR